VEWRGVEASGRSRSSTTISAGRSAARWRGPGSSTADRSTRLLRVPSALALRRGDRGRAGLRSLLPRARRARLASPARAGLGVTPSPDTTAASTVMERTQWRSAPANWRRRRRGADRARRRSHHPPQRRGHVHQPGAAAPTPPAGRALGPGPPRPPRQHRRAAARFGGNSTRSTPLTPDDERFLAWAARLLDGLRGRAPGHPRHAAADAVAEIRSAPRRLVPVSYRYKRMWHRLDAGHGVPAPRDPWCSRATDETGIPGCKLSSTKRIFSDHRGWCCTEVSRRSASPRETQAYA
jgi:hypothetical protein